MRIGIDARMYGPEQGGLGRYIEQLVLHLEQLNTQDEFIIFLRTKNWDAYKPNKSNFKKVLADIPWYGWKEQFQMPNIIKEAKVDLVHFPHWNVPIFYNKPFVVTLHDLLLLHYPSKKATTLGPLMYWFKYQAYLKTLRHAAHESQHILTVSEFSKQDINKTLHVPFNKITVTYLAPTTPNQQPTLPAEDVLNKYGITSPYVLYVGVAFPHKNLEGLINAWELFQKKFSDHTTKLVLVGKKNYFYEQLIPRIQTNKNIIYTDFVPDSDLPTIYKNASLYVMPSFYEGSALPSLEALQYGIPVASSNQTCLPEILQNAAFYFDPKNIENIADMKVRCLHLVELENFLGKLTGQHTGL
jgi:glycosyltransferase involved in cell wall biosynthesis